MCTKNDVKQKGNAKNQFSYTVKQSLLTVFTLDIVFQNLQF